MPPVFGPRSPSHRRLWSRAAGSATARVAVADGDDAGLGTREPLLDHQRRLARRAAGQERRDERQGLLERVGDDDALARREAVGLEHGERARPRPAPGRTPRPRPRRRRRRPAPGPCGPRPPRRPRGRTPWTSPSGPRPAAGPKTAIPAASSASATPAPSGASGPTTTRSAASRPGQRHDGGGVQRVHGDAAHARLLRDPRAPGRHDHLVDAGLAGQLPRERVLATAAAEDQDAGGHGGRHAGSSAQAGVVGRCRIGRQARSIVWVRSGPTETNTIGTPACSSSADT